MLYVLDTHPSKNWYFLAVHRASCWFHYWPPLESMSHRLIWVELVGIQLEWPLGGRLEDYYYHKFVISVIIVVPIGWCTICSVVGSAYYISAFLHRNHRGRLRAHSLEGENPGGAECRENGSSLARILTWSYTTLPVCTYNDVILSLLHRCMLAYPFKLSHYCCVTIKSSLPGAKTRA